MSYDQSEAWYGFFHEWKNRTGFPAFQGSNALRLDKWLAPEDYLFENLTNS